MLRLILLFVLVYSSLLVRGQSGNFDFIDDFNSGTAERWQTVGNWRVQSGAYIGNASGVYSGTNAFIRGFAAQDVYMEADMESLWRVDKYILLRYAGSSNLVALNFRANPYNDLVVHQTRN